MRRHARAHARRGDGAAARVERKGQGASFLFSSLLCASFLCASFLCACLVVSAARLGRWRPGWSAVLPLSSTAQAVLAACRWREQGQPPAARWSDEQREPLGCSRPLEPGARWTRQRVTVAAADFVPRVGGASAAMADKAERRAASGDRRAARSAAMGRGAACGGLPSPHSPHTLSTPPTGSLLHLLITIVSLAVWHKLCLHSQT